MIVCLNCRAKCLHGEFVVKHILIKFTLYSYSWGFMYEWQPKTNMVYYDTLFPSFTKLGTGEDSQGTNPQSCSTPLLWRIEGDHSMGGISGFNTKRLTLDHSGSRVWRVPCSLHTKDSFCRFRKSVVAVTKDYYFLPYPTPHIFSLEVKCR